ncbi:MAG: double zinc ribbon domain-containing protein, partial [Sphingomicrobium sp.]
MRWLRSIARSLLDFMLPPRCAGCGTIVDQLHSFCPDCWTNVEFLGNSGCVTCGIPLEATDAEHCGACLAQPPLVARTRAAVDYDDLSRSLAIRLKYGRKVALARTMGRFMAPLIDVEGLGESDGDGGALLIPVPLHRTRLWQRGFNQAALIAGDLSRRLQL